MIAGSLAVLLQSADEPLEDYHDSGQRAIDVNPPQADLDGEPTVQTGMIAGKVPKQRTSVSLNGNRISSEQRERDELVETSFVADVDGRGWIVAESTHPTDREWGPPWPFMTVQRRTGCEVTPVNVAPDEFAQRQADADRDTVTELVAKRTGADDVSIEWGAEASTADAPSADIGVALRTLWQGQFVRVVIYKSGYLAVWEPEDWSPSAFGRFVEEEILPVAFIPEDDEDEGQTDFDEFGESNTGDDFADEVEGYLEDEGHDVERGGEPGE